VLITSFSAGELSKKLFGRVDLPLYASGAARIENFEVVPTGGLVRRPGTRRHGSLAGPCRLIPFIVNSTNSFLLEIGSTYIYIWQNGTLLKSDGGVPIRFSSSDTMPLYSSLEEIKEIQYAQTFNEIYLVHRNYPPYKIAWAGGTTFELVKLTFTGNVDEIPFQTTQNYPGVITFFNGRLWLGSTISEPQKIWASKPFDYTNFVQYETVITNSTRIRDPDLHIFTASITEGESLLTGTTQDLSTLDTVNDAKIDRHVFLGKAVKGGYELTYYGDDLSWISNQINYYISGTGITPGTKVKKITKTTILMDMQASVSSDPGSFSIQLVETAHSLTDYYVTGPGIDIGTKVLAASINTLSISTAAKKTSAFAIFSIQLWRDADSASSSDYDTIYFSNDVTASGSAFQFEIASDKNDGIKWMCSQNDLIIGTESSEWIVPASVTAINIQAVLNTRNGSAGIQAVMIGPSTMFFQQGGRSLREYFYQVDNTRYLSQNLTAWNPELLEESPAIDFDYTNSPSPRAIITRKDGKLGALIYEKDQAVAAWYRIVLARGLARSTATVPAESGVDMIYFAIQDGEYWYLESLADDDLIFIDHYQSIPITAGQSVDYSGLGYDVTAEIFNATTKKIVPVTAIPVDFYTSGDVCFIGYRYDSTVESLPVVKDGSNNQKRIISVTLRLLESAIPYVSSGKAEELPNHVAPYSGIVKVPVPSDWSTDVFFKVRTNEPAPCTVLALNIDIQ
jgi:hypothetical protein